MGVSDRCFSDTAGLEIYRRSLSNFCLSQAYAETPAYRLSYADISMQEDWQSFFDLERELPVGHFPTWLLRQITGLAHIATDGEGK